VEGGCIVFGNAAFARLQGAFGEGGLTQASLADHFSPGTVEGLQALARALAAGQAANTLLSEFRPLQHGGQQWVQIHATLLQIHPPALLLNLRAMPPEAEMLMSRALQPQELRAFSDRLLQAREDERRHLSRELHDELGQQLSALKLCVSNLGNSPDVQELRQKTPSALTLIDGIVAATRRIAADLRPLMLDDLGLNAAIEWLAKHVEARSPLRIQLRLDACSEGLAEPYTTALYRMVQEALTNIERHAQATAVTVELQGSRTELSLRVSDNGLGFPPGAAHPRGSHGLVGLRERARMLGGTLELDNLPGAGASVQVRLPYPRPIALALTP
jgi:signal transduction histidine kinase